MQSPVLQAVHGSGILSRCLPMIPKNKSEIEKSKPESRDDDNSPKDNERSKEIGGRGGLDPTRYGDWEKGGRCIDF